MLKIYIANLGKYNEGELVGKWVELPCEDLSVKTCIKKTIELYKSYPDIYADTLNKTVKVIAYSTPNGYTRQQAVWTATIDEFKMLINNFY